MVNDIENSMLIKCPDNDEIWQVVLV